MKITIFPREKGIFRAVSWYASQVAKEADSYAEMIGEKVSLSLNKKVFLENGLSVHPVKKGDPRTIYGGDLEIYTELEIECPNEELAVEFIEKAKKIDCKKLRR